MAAADVTAAHRNRRWRSWVEPTGHLRLELLKQGHQVGYRGLFDHAAGLNREKAHAEVAEPAAGGRQHPPRQSQLTVVCTFSGGSEGPPSRRLQAAVAP